MNSLLLSHWGYDKCCPFSQDKSSSWLHYYVCLIQYTAVSYVHCYQKSGKKWQTALLSKGAVMLSYQFRHWIWRGFYCNNGTWFLPLAEGHSQEYFHCVCEQTRVLVFYCMLLSTQWHTSRCLSLQALLSTWNLLFIRLFRTCSGFKQWIDVFWSRVSPLLQWWGWNVRDSERQGGQDDGFFWKHPPPSKPQFSFPEILLPTEVILITF